MDTPKAGHQRRLTSFPFQRSCQYFVCAVFVWVSGLVASIHLCRTDLEFLGQGAHQGLLHHPFQPSKLVNVVSQAIVLDNPTILGLVLGDDAVDAIVGSLPQVVRLPTAHVFAAVFMDHALGNS